MIGDPLGEVLILLVAAVLVVTAARRAGLPAILGYLLVGVLLGPHVFGLFAESATTRLLSELGVVFLLFTLGLEFSWPRMMAMRREVFGIGSAQVALTVLVVSIVFLSVGVATLPAIALGGAIAVSSTAIILQQLTEQSDGLIQLFHFLRLLELLHPFREPAFRDDFVHGQAACRHIPTFRS